MSIHSIPSSVFMKFKLPDLPSKYTPEMETGKRNGSRTVYVSMAQPKLSVHFSYICQLPPFHSLRKLCNVCGRFEFVGQAVFEAHEMLFARQQMLRTIQKDKKTIVQNSGKLKRLKTANAPFGPSKHLKTIYETP